MAAASSARDDSDGSGAGISARAASSSDPAGRLRRMFSDRCLTTGYRNVVMDAVSRKPGIAGEAPGETVDPVAVAVVEALEGLGLPPIDPLDQVLVSFHLRAPHTPNQNSLHAGPMGLPARA